MEEDWEEDEEENEMDLYEEDEEELENIQDEIDEICSRATSCENCTWEVCGDLFEIICDDEEEELE